MDVVIFGVGELAEVITWYLTETSDFNVVGYTVDREYVPITQEYKGRPVVAWEDIAETFPPERYQILGPVSYRNLNQLRRDRYLEGKAKGYKFATYVHPSSHVGGAEIGENTIILEECTVQPFAKIGVCSILWSKVHIGHHATIGDYCFFASFCGIAGAASVGDCTFFGGQSGLVDNTNVGSHCLIGAGTTLTESVPDGALAVARGVRIVPKGAKRFARTLLG